MPKIEFFFDCSSPWTYLGFSRMQELAQELNVTVDWRPFLVGGVFNTVNPSIYESRANPVPAKQRYLAKDLQDWARYCGLRIRWPPTVFPANSVKAMRGCLAAAESDKLAPFALATFAAYWSDDRDISQDAVISDIAALADLDANALLARITEPTIKQALRSNTDELIARGGFGSPTIFVNGDNMYFGNDRMPLIRDVLERVRT